ncbi:MAG: IlvD/Edd family dehydratase [Nocardioides sp.]|uniref:IlvD/Edd family dehydratase n=1 Tax=Nocardioides sp. TaxID=35761 RepID=UPI0039E53B41
MRQPDQPPLRSGEWLARTDLDGFLHRAYLKADGFTDEAFEGKPLIGICNPWSDLVGCHGNFRELAESIKRGVLQAGGFPLEFPVMPLGESLMRPTAMLYRNLGAMEIEECLRAYPFDAAVLLCGCDKSVPAALMGAASADIPTILVTAGPMLDGRFEGRQIGACTDCWLFHEELRAGRLTREEWQEIENGMCRSVGTCQTMGTASTMACLTEALGMSLSGGAAIPAVDSRRRALAERSGRRAVELVAEDLRPSAILTREAFEDAIRVLHAISGSTNGIIHLLAVARRAGVQLELDDFDTLGRDTPWLVNVKPAGDQLMEAFFYGGGLPAVLAELQDQLHLDRIRVDATPLRELLPARDRTDRKVIASREDPLSPTGGLVVLRGSLAPSGSVLKVTAAEPRLMQHQGTALVFETLAELAVGVNDPDLECDEDTVLILRGGGPVGAPGMPEWGHLPIPLRLLERGVTDLVRISDARISGTSFGAVVAHVAPEAAIGGPLALVETGDQVRVDVEGRRIDLLVDEEELQRRRAAWTPPARGSSRGYRSLYLQHVTQADEGCDFDFLAGSSDVERDALSFL